MTVPKTKNLFYNYTHIVQKINKTPMKKVTNNNSTFVKIMAGILAGLMVAGVFTTVVIMLVQ